MTNESLQNLEASYNQSQGNPTGISFPQMQATASGFLGRLWAGSSNSHQSVKSLNPNSSPTRPNSTIRRSTSKQSLTSTLNSVETTSDASTAPTELSTATTGTDGHKSRVKSNMSSHHKDRDLHTQIEDLLMALSDLQRQQADLTRELQQEREDREEDHALAKEMLSLIQEMPAETPAELINKAKARFEPSVPRRISITQTKLQLNDDVARWKEMHEVEAGRCLDLTRRIDDFEKENSSLKEQLREARGRIQDGYRDRQRLERMNRELRTIKTPNSASATPPDTSPSSATDYGEAHSPTNGLRELKLTRTNSTKSPTYSKRSSSLGLQNVLATENNRPAGEEALLMELVTSKTAEAVAKQELEEVKAKLESLRKMISPSQAARAENRHSFIGLSPSRMSLAKAATEPSKQVMTPPATNTGGGGFFSGWGRRANNEAPS